jgi:2-iminobutanoate/2-iminopropanoate deaminase
MPKRVLDIPGIGSIITVQRDGQSVQLPIAEAVEAHGFVLVAGKGGHLHDNPADPDAVFGEETRIALEQIRQRLDGLGLTFRDVVRTTVMLADWHDFEAARWSMNAVYSSYFPTEPPVRLLFGAAHLPGANHVEIEVLAAR